MWISKEFNKEDFNSLLELCYEYYGKNDITDKEFVQHEYFKNFAGTAYIDLAIDRQTKEIVGQYVAIPKKINIDSTEKSCILSLNTLTKREYWGQGIFTGLAEKTYDRACNNGELFCYGVPNPNSHPGFLKKLKFHDLGNIPLWIKPLNLSALIEEKTNKKWMGSLFKWSNCLVKPRFKDNSNYKVQKLDNNNIYLIDRLWNKIKDEYPVCFIRDSQYIKWRYLDIPLRNYIPYVILKGEKICGFIVGRVMKVSGISCGMIVDFMFENHEYDAAYCLLDYITNIFYEQQVSLIGSLMLRHTKEAKILKRKHFFICPSFLEPQPFPFIFRLLDDNYEKQSVLNKIENWFFTMGDYDVI